MKISLFILLLFTSGLRAQNFSNYDFTTPYSSQLIDVIEYETGYLLTGYITDSSFTVTSDLYGSPVLLKLSKSGMPIDTLYTDSFGYSELAQLSIYKDGYFYMFGTTNPPDDSIQLVVNKYDTLFNFISKRIYPQVKDGNYFMLHKSNKITDSTMYFIGGLYNYHAGNYNSFVFKYNFNTMELSKYTLISDNLLSYSMIVKESEDLYIISGTSISFISKVLIFDSNFNLVREDTLFDPHNSPFTLQSNINILKYRHNSYLCIGTGELLVPFNYPTHSNRAIEIQILDSNLELKENKYWYYDSISYFTLSTSNTLIENTNNEYFIGATIRTNYFYPDSGLLIIKTDSNLNTLWQKHIKCEAETMTLNNLLPISDGGVLILYTEQASLLGAELQNSKLMKIGPNGEVTNITDLKNPNRKAVVSIYPNPTSQHLNIKLLENTQNIDEIRIYDLQFKEILNRKINATQTTIDVNRLAKGVYFVEGTTNTGEVFIEKFVVE